MKELLKIDTNFMRICLVFVLIVACCSLFLVGTSILPQNIIQERISIAADQLSEADKEGQYFGEKRLDNFLSIGVDAVVLNFIYMQDNTKSILNRAFIYRQYVPAINGYEDVNNQVAYLKETSMLDSYQEENVLLFPGYWLGYVGILRGLFCFLSYKNIIYVISEIALIVGVSVCLYVSKKLNIASGLAVGLGLLSINYYVLSNNLFEGVFCVLISLLSYPLILSTKRHRYSRFISFMIVGMFTAYFDYFSIPFITYSGAILLAEDNKNETIVKQFNEIWNASIGWIIGYVGMIMTKVLIAFCLVGSEAFRFVTERIGMETTVRFEYSWKKKIFDLVTLLHPFSAVQGRINGIIIVGSAIMLASIVLVYNFRTKCKEHFVSTLIICLISFSPMVWFCVFKGHIHHGFDYRVLYISVMGIVILCRDLIDIMSRKFNIHLNEKK